MEKHSRGKTETWSGRRLQEERCLQEEQVSPLRPARPSGVLGKQQGAAHRVRHWGTLNFGKLRCCLATWDTTWPPTQGVAKEKSCWWEEWWMWVCFQSHRLPWRFPAPHFWPLKCSSGAWTRNTSYKVHRKSYICNRKYLLKGHLALFPNPLYPHVHHDNQAFLFCYSTAHSQAFRGTAWSFYSLAGAVNESCAWQTGCSKQNPTGYGTHMLGELVVVPAGREQQ